MEVAGIEPDLYHFHLLRWFPVSSHLYPQVITPKIDSQGSVYYWFTLNGMRYQDLYVQLYTV